MSDKSSIYGVNSNGEAILRTSENATGERTSIYGVNSDGKACMRVSSKVTSNDPTSIYGVNDSGEACVRIDGAGGGGSKPVVESLNVTPTTSAQTITASDGVDGYSPVNVSAVDSSIDANITAENIKKDVSILGVTGTYTGTQPTGSINITSNGTYNVVDKAEAVVNVPTAAPTYYIEKNVDANGTLTGGAATMMNWTGIKKITGQSVLAYAYRNSLLSGAITIGDYTEAADYGCLSSFLSLSKDITSAVVLITVGSGTSCFQSMFEGCTSLETVDWSALTTITGGTTFWSTFISCHSLKLVKLNGLVTITSPLAPSYGVMFGSTESLESVTFGGLKASTFASRVDQLQYLFNNTSGSNAPNGCTVHFPSNFDPTDPNHTFDASTLSGYPTFGGNADYIHVAFDLPATE